MDNSMIIQVENGETYPSGPLGNDGSHSFDPLLDLGNESIPDMTLLATPCSAPRSASRLTPGSISKPPKRPSTVAGRKAVLKQRIALTLEMRDTLMNCFLRCKQEGLMNIDKAAELKPVWLRVCKEMKEAYSGYAWTETKIATEYRVCKKRWRQWLTLLDRSGNGPDDDGIMQASEACWQWFLDKVPDGKWMRTEPLSINSTFAYEEVFEKETAIGRFIAEAGDEDNIPNIESDGDSHGDNRDDSFLVPKARGPRKRRYNPDFNTIISDLSESEAEHSPPTSPSRSQPLPSKKKSRISSRNDEEKGGEIAAIDRLAISMSRPTGSDDIVSAIDIIERLGGMLGAVEKIHAFRVMTTNPLNAVTLQQIRSDEDRIAFLRSLSD
ncbi:hypothetical protein F4861DRAFT_543529 [Xylaria intraflava]|nr:hypothetical protein F4861DRAFT_543529 [Xylaria intraflava]